MGTPGRFALWIIIVSASLTVMAGSIIAPVLNLIRDGLNVAPTSAGLIITTHGLFIAICSPLIGIIIDRYGAKRPFMFGLVLYGLAGGSGLYINSFWLLIIGRAFLGIAVAAILNSIAVMILNLYEGMQRNKVMGWRGSSNSFGGVVWPLIGGFLGRTSWHLPFAIYMVGIPLGLLTLASLPEVHKEEKQDTDKGTSVIQVFRNRPILFAIYGLQFLGMVLLYAIVVFLPPLLERIGISNPFYIGIFISTSSLASGLTALMYGRIKSRLSYKMIVLIVLALWTLGFTTVSQVSSGLLIGVSVALYGIGTGMLLPSVPVWAGEIVPISFRGRIISYIGTFGYVGQFLSPVIFSPVLLSLGLKEIFLVAGGACVVVFLLFLTLMRK